MAYYTRRDYNLKSLFTKGQSLLHHLDIELTERCNNACQHCYINLPVGDERAAQRELTTEQWQYIIKQAEELGALSVRFTGGEPLLRPDFTELYLFARRLGIKVQLFTNARLITPEMAELFAQVPPLKKIEISVYGMRPESYDAVACAAGAFTEFWQGIRRLLDLQIPFRVTFVQLPPNRADLGDFESWASMNHGADVVSNSELYLELRTRRDSPIKNRLIKCLRISPQESLALLERNQGVYRREIAQFCSRFIGPRGDRLFTCGAGTSGCVDAYGTYQMCMLLRHPDTVYHLSKGTLREALTDFFPPLRELRATNPAYLQRCARCFLLGLCEQCPAKSWSEHGSLDTPVEYLCEIAHAQARYLELIREGEFGWEVSNWQARVDTLVKHSASLSDSQYPAFTG